MELFTDGLLEAVEDSFSVEATFRRNGATKTVTVVPGSRQVVVTDGPSGFLQVPERQTTLRIRASELRREFGDPVEDDEFLIQLADRLQTWRVLKPNSRSKAVVPTDHNNVGFRCYTKLTEEVTTLSAPADADLEADKL